MQTIRWRLTVFYGVALSVTVAVFAAILYLERRAALARDADRQVAERLAFEVESVKRYIENNARTLPDLVVELPGEGGAIGTPVLATEIRAYLDGLRDNIYLMDLSGRLVFVSLEAGDLAPPALNRIRQTMLRQPIVPRAGRLRLDSLGPSHHYLLDTLAGPARNELRAFLVTARAEPDLTGARQILLLILVISPLILVGSGLMGYWLGARALTPLESLIQEVEAIQDGRSLHRRLAVPPGNDELARLGANLNAMLGRVERSFVALRRFTADASHELKTPLMVLRAGVERSLTHPETPGEVVHSLDETLRQINEMTELVTNLLTLARSDEGRASLVLVEADLKPLVAEAGETAEILGEEHGVVVTVSLPPGPLVASIEPGRVRQMLMNLITNAIKYTPRGGAVELSLAEEEQEAVIQVRDTGIGIAPGDLPHVFERFWRADPARSRTGERPGVGLGLAIVKWVVDAHGGTITVQSRPGRGSTFRVTLPLTVPVAEVPAAED
jgi:signal transduction histidine kinase